MLLARTLFIVFILSLSFIGPYKAFLSSYPEINKEFIEIESGSSMLSTLDILNSGSLINNFYFKVFIQDNRSHSSRTFCSFCDGRNIHTHNNSHRRNESL